MNHFTDDRIYQLLRNSHEAHNVSMICEDNTDRPLFYKCLIFGYEFCYLVNSHDMYLFKQKKMENKICLQHYYYISKDMPYYKNPVVENGFVEPITQEELAKIANEDWCIECNTETDTRLMTVMKEKFIECLIANKQIYYSEKKKEYMSYDLYISFECKDGVKDIRKTIYAFDFDDTLFTGNYPNVGEPIIETIQFLKERKLEGCNIILLTMREGDSLKEALKACEEYGIEFDAVNDNLPRMISVFGRNPRKIYADYYIDDHNLFLKSVNKER